MSHEIEVDHHPGRDGKCIGCGVEIFSPKPDPETPAPELGEVLEHNNLDSYHPGTRVTDCQGDIWVKQTDGRWKWTHATLSSPSLFHIFSPLRLVGEVI